MILLDAVKPIADQVPETLETVLKYVGSAATVAGSVWGYIAVFNARRKKAMAAADRPSESPPAARPNPFGTPPATDPALRAEVLEIKHQIALQRLEWQLADRTRELEQIRAAHARELADVRRERDEAVADARDTAASLAAAQAKVEAHAARIQSLEEAIERAQRPDTAITPLRPKAR